jgi:hypothetical protein
MHTQRSQVMPKAARQAKSRGKETATSFKTRAFSSYLIRATWTKHAFLNTHDLNVEEGSAAAKRPQS